MNGLFCGLAVGEAALFISEHASRNRTTVKTVFRRCGRTRRNYQLYLHVCLLKGIDAKRYT